MKKILKNKLSLILIILIDIISFLILIAVFNIFIIILYEIIIHIILFQIILKRYFNIWLINFQKFKNIILNKKTQKSLSKDEFYLKRIKINTFDGSGSTTHPCILFFKNGFNNYKYWMVHTPYDNNNVEFENPTLCVSNDGINFKNLDQVKNPLLPIIKKRKPYTFYNDPFIMYTDKLEIWYRYTIEGVQLINDIYRITSYDGINWTNPQLMIKSDGKCYMSLSIVKHNNLYYMYYFNMNYRFMLKTSKDLLKWSHEIELKINNFDCMYWHGEAKYLEEKLYLLFIDKDNNLYISASTDMYNFSNPKKINLNYYSKINMYSNLILYKSTFVDSENYIYIYIPFRISHLDYFKIKNALHKKWELTLIKVKKETFNRFMK